MDPNQSIISAQGLVSKLAGCRFSPPANVAHRVQCEAKVRGTSSQQVSTQEMKTPNSRSTMVYTFHNI